MIASAGLVHLDNPFAGPDRAVRTHGQTRIRRNPTFALWPPVSAFDNG